MHGVFWVNSIIDSFSHQQALINQLGTIGVCPHCSNPQRIRTWHLLITSRTPNACRLQVRTHLQVREQSDEHIVERGIEYINEMRFELLCYVYVMLLMTDRKPSKSTCANLRKSSWFLDTTFSLNDIHGIGCIIHWMKQMLIWTRVFIVRDNEDR